MSIVSYSYDDHPGMYRGYEFISEDGTPNWEIVEDIIMRRVPFPENERKHLEKRLTVNRNGRLCPIWKFGIPIEYRYIV